MENSDTETIVGSVAASDVDVMDADLTYDIVGGNVGNAFAIDHTTGEITVDNKAALDFEINPVFDLTVQVDDNNGEDNSTNTAAVTINLSDLEATLSINGLADAESNGPFIFAVELTGDDINTPFNVTYSTTDGSALDAGTETASNDYDGIASGTISFAGNATNETHTVGVVVNDDNVVEPDENFYVNLLSTTSNDVTIGVGQAEGIIENDDFLSGRVFDDLDNDGVFDQEDAGIEGVSMQLINETSDMVVDTTSTAADGRFEFDVTLEAGTYKMVEMVDELSDLDLLDGKETAGVNGGTVVDSQDSNEITAIDVSGSGAADEQAVDYLFAEIRPSDIQGLVWEDFNNDASVNFGEKAIPGVTVTLTGTDDRENVVSEIQKVTDDDGVYMFIHLRPSNGAGYNLRETQPDPSLWVDGKDAVGEVNGVISGDHDGGIPPLSTTDDQFTTVVLPHPASLGINYNFGERPVSEGVVTPGQTATIGFWHNKNGQALIKSLNGSEQSVELGNWLAATFPNMYGDDGDPENGENPNDLTGKTNVDVADFYSDLFLRKKKEAEKLGLTGPTKMDAQVMGVAFASYVTSETLAGTTAAAYGFLVTEHGVGMTTFNVDADAAEAFDGLIGEVAILDLLFATNDMSLNGVLYDLDGDGETDDIFEGLDETLLRTLANDVYSAINEAGDI